MNSSDTLLPLKGGEEPTEVLKVLVFSFIETLRLRGEVSLVQLNDENGKPVTVVAFHNTDYQHLTDVLEPEKESVGNAETA